MHNSVNFLVNSVIFSRCDESEVYILFKNYILVYNFTLNALNNSREK